mgnify:CR=1 FL=1
MNWSRIISRYIAIATIGSVLIVVGTYFLHFYQIDVRLDKNMIIAKIDESRETVADLFQNYVIPETLTNGPTANPSKPPQVVDKPTNGPVAVVTHTPKPAASNRKWGVVRNLSTKAYNRSGKFLRNLESGMLVDITDIKDTSAGELAVCKVLYQGQEIPDIVIKTSDLDIQRGTLSEANPKEKDLRVQYVQMLRDISSREKELLEADKSKNPHYAQFKAAEVAYQDLKQRTDELIRKRDTAEGSDRMEVYDKLRMMKSESIPVKQAYEEAKQKYNGWIATQARQQVAANDEKLASLKAKLRGIEDDLRAFPGK